MAPPLRDSRRTAAGRGGMGRHGAAFVDTATGWLRGSFLWKRPRDGSEVAATKRPSGCHGVATANEVVGCCRGGHTCVAVNASAGRS